MNDRLFRTILKRYEANIEDALYKIHCINDQQLVIPEHIDITGEIDERQLEIIATNEDKLAVLRKYYVSQDKKTLL